MASNANGIFAYRKTWHHFLPGHMKQPGNTVYFCTSRNARWTNHDRVIQIVLYQCVGHKTYNTDDEAVNWRSSSFKVIDFYCNRKPIYDFLLVINSDRSPISHRFRDIASGCRKLWAPLSRGPFKFRHQTWQPKSWGAGIHFGKNRIILSLAVLSQYTCVTDRRQTDDRRHFMAIAESCIATFD